MKACEAGKLCCSGARKRASDFSLWAIVQRSELFRNRTGRGTEIAPKVLANKYSPAGGRVLFAVQ
jgi:hypothetical protein